MSPDALEDAAGPKGKGTKGKGKAKGKVAGAGGDSETHKSTLVGSIGEVGEEGLVKEVTEWLGAPSMTSYQTLHIIGPKMECKGQRKGATEQTPLGTKQDRNPKASTVTVLTEQRNAGSLYQSTVPVVSRALFQFWAVLFL